MPQPNVAKPNRNANAAQWLVVCESLSVTRSFYCDPAAAVFGLDWSNVQSLINIVIAEMHMRICTYNFSFYMSMR